MKGQVADTEAKNQLSFTLSLKSVNHRFLDLHFRLPSDTDALEMKLRRLLKEKLARGHVELSLNLDRAGSDGFALNRQLVGGYIQAFRAAAAEFGLAADPDLNVVLRIPGALDSGTVPADDGLENAVLLSAEKALERLNQMREEEGKGIDKELRTRMEHISKAASAIEKHRKAILQTYAEKLKTRMQELLSTQVDQDRILQEAALLVDRSDIQEELVRLDTHVKHFVGMLDAG